MIKSFKHRGLKIFWNTGSSSSVKPELKDATTRKLDMLNAANALKDLRSPPGNRLHPLRGDRKGQWAISVNGPWRLCFRFEDGHIYDVELLQYH